MLQHQEMVKTGLFKIAIMYDFLFRVNWANVIILYAENGILETFTLIKLYNLYSKERLI